MVKNDIHGGRNRVRFYMIGERVDAVAAALQRIAAQRGWDRIDIASDPHTVELVVVAVSAVTGVSPEVQRQLQAARSAGVPNLVVAVDQIDELQDPELLGSR